MHVQIPTVVALPVHLPGKHNFIFDANQDSMSTLEREDHSKTILMGYFESNIKYPQVWYDGSCMCNFRSNLCGGKNQSHESITSVILPLVAFILQLLLRRAVSFHTLLSVVKGAR